VSKFTDPKEGDKRIRTIFLFGPLQLENGKRLFGFAKIQEVYIRKTINLIGLNQEVHVINKMKWVKKAFVYE
jgi:hypothetical protein